MNEFVSLAVTQADALKSGLGSVGYGLAAIRARLQQFGGTLTVESTPGDGTVLSAAIPLGAP